MRRSRAGSGITNGRGLAAVGAAGNVFFGGMNGNQYRVRVHREFDPGGIHPRTAGDAFEFSSELFADAAVDFLGAHKGDAPFFAYCAFTSPHDPRTPPAPYSTMYDPGKMELPANFLPEHPFDNGELKIRDEMLAPFPRTPENTRKQLCDYYGMVSSQDEQVGEDLAGAGEFGAGGEHAGRLHGRSWVGDGVARVVREAERVRAFGGRADGVARARGGGGGAREIQGLVYGMDVFPTICRVTGVDVPSGVEGKDLTEVMRGKER